MGEGEGRDRKHYTCVGGGGGEGRGEGWQDGKGGRDRIKALYLCYNKQRRAPYTVTIAWHVTINAYEVNDLHHNSSGAV